MLPFLFTFLLYNYLMASLFTPEEQEGVEVEALSVRRADGQRPYRWRLQ
jgi:hypothetical protein